MTASAFDPLAAVQALEAAGVDRRHAEAYATQLRAVRERCSRPMRHQHRSLFTRK